MSLFPFQPNYPRYPGYTILSVPDRVSADSTVTGRGVTIAFIDSGFYPHPDLGKRIIYQVDATTEKIAAWRRFHEPTWDSWHGQMTSVIAAGAGDKFPGIACGASLVLIKVSTVQHRIKEKDILRGLRWVIANHIQFGIRVVNISVGGDFVSFDPAHPLHQAVARLTREGVTVCVAAGNASMPNLVPPASAPEAITVGGYNDLNTRDRHRWEAYHSNWGKSYDGTLKPEILAPASWIASPILAGTAMMRRAYWLAQMIGADESPIRALLRAGYEDLELSRRRAWYPTAEVYRMLQAHIHHDKLIDATHQHVDGTSVAVAIVSSIVAQMIEVKPDATPKEIKARLMQSADPLDHFPHERQGGGVINPARALAMLRQSLTPVEAN